MEHSSRALFSVVAVSCLLFGLASIAMAFPFFWKQYDVVKNWPAATAVVQSSDVAQITMAGEKLWSTRFELTYQAGARQVTTNLNGYRQGSDLENVRAAAARFPKGSQVLVRYSPANPEEIRLDTDHPRRYYQLPLALFITGSIFVVIALTLFFIARRG